jgi:uncharacterized membrane protein YfcA
MEPHVILLVLATFMFAAFLKGTAGLGFATTCLGLMASYLDVRLAIPLVVIPSLVSNGMVMIDAGGFRPILRRFWFMYLAALPGLGLGLWLLGSGDTTLPRAVLGAAMFLYGCWGLWGGVTTMSESPWVAGPIGLTTGLVNGLTGSQVMPILPYLMSLRLTKDELVQAINTSFTLASLVMLVGLNRLGMFTTDIALVSAAGVVPVAAGIWLGGRVRRRLPEIVFRRVVLMLLVLLGAGLMIKAYAA